MATLVSELRGQLNREINIPGFEQLPDITNSQLDGYIQDGFWECRLVGLLEGYTATDGTELATPLGPVIKNVSNDGDLEQQWQMLVVIMSGLKLIRLKVLNLAINFNVSAGPISYEQQASATTLRAILASLTKRLDELKTLYSSSLSQAAFFYFDGALQREQSLIDDVLILGIQ